MVSVYSTYNHDNNHSNHNHNHHSVKRKRKVNRNDPQLLTRTAYVDASVAQLQIKKVNRFRFLIDFPIFIRKILLNIRQIYEQGPLYREFLKVYCGFGRIIHTIITDVDIEHQSKLLSYDRFRYLRLNQVLATSVTSDLCCISFWSIACRFRFCLLLLDLIHKFLNFCKQIELFRRHDFFSWSLSNFGEISDQLN